MVKQHKITLIALIVMGYLLKIMCSCFVISAVEDEWKVINNALKINSPNYTSIELNVQENINQYQLYKAKYDNSLEQEKQYSYLEEKSKDNLAKTTLEYWLNMQLSAFYNTNKSIIIEQMQKKLEYNLLVEYYKLPLFVSQKNYYLQMLEQDKANLKVEKKKYEQGYSSKMNVNEASSKVKSTKNRISNISREIEILKKNICSGTKIDNVIGVCEVPIIDNVKSEQYYIDNYLKGYQYINYCWQADTYTQYKISLQEKFKDSTVMNAISDNKISLLMTQKESYEINVITTVRDLLKDYSSYVATVQEKKNSITSIDSKIINYKKAYKAGVIKCSSLLELYTQKAKLNLELQDAQYGILKTYYLLEYGVMQ